MHRFVAACQHDFFTRRSQLTTGNPLSVRILPLQLKPSPRKSRDEFVQGHAQGARQSDGVKQAWVAPKVEYVM
jgi:hypothetical protein